jgi:hypothetical protein
MGQGKPLNMSKEASHLPQPFRSFDILGIHHTDLAGDYVDAQNAFLHHGEPESPRSETLPSLITCVSRRRATDRLSDRASVLRTIAGGAMEVPMDTLQDPESG